MIISDPIGLFTIPYALTMASNAWDLLNETSLVLVPFGILIVYETYKALTSSSDTGSAAMQAFVNVDLKFMGMVILIILTAMPMSGTPKFTYSQYSCSSTPSVLENIDDTDDLKPNSGFTYGTEQPAPLVGLVHDVATAIDGVLIAQLPCTKGVSQSDVSTIQNETFPTGPQLYQSIKSFHAQCYLRARSNIESHLAKGENLAYAESDLETKNSFSSTLMYYAYAGYITDTSVPDDGNLQLEVDETWVGDQSSSSIDCTTASSILKEAISSDLVSQEDFDDNVQTMLEYYNLYGNYDTSDVLADLINLVYFNVSTLPTENSKLGFQEAIESLNNDSFTNSTASLLMSSNPALGVAQIMATSKYANTMSENGGWEVAKEMATDVFILLGSGYTAITENLKAHMAIIALPLIATICMSFMLAVMPIYVVASGYSYSKVWHFFILYMSLALIPFWVNFSVVIDTIIQSYMAANVDTTTTVSRWITSGAGAIIIYSGAGIWILLMQMVAGASAQAIGGIMAGGIAGATAGLQSAQKEGSKAASSKARGSNNNASNTNSQVTSSVVDS